MGMLQEAFGNSECAQMQMKKNFFVLHMVDMSQVYFLQRIIGLNS
jgi:hypothetical protein